MKILKHIAIVLTCFTPVALSATGCVLLPGGNLGNGPFAISPVAVKVSPLQNDKVHLTISSGGASIGLNIVFVRVARGKDILLRESYDWNYQQGLEADLGNSDMPLRSGDKVQVGTSDVNTHVELSVSP